MLLNLKGLLISIRATNADTVIKSDGNYLLSNEVFMINISSDLVAEYLQENFIFLEETFNKTAYTSDSLVSQEDVNNIYYSISTYFMHMYNNWNNIYKKAVKKSLLLSSSDLKSASMIDVVSAYFKNKQDNDWMLKSANVLGMPELEFIEKYSEREKYYNK